MQPPRPTSRLHKHLCGNPSVVLRCLHTRDMTSSLTLLLLMDTAMVARQSGTKLTTVLHRRQQILWQGVVVCSTNSSVFMVHAIFADDLVIDATSNCRSRLTNNNDTRNTCHDDQYNFEILLHTKDHPTSESTSDLKLLPITMMMNRFGKSVAQA